MYSLSRGSSSLSICSPSLRSLSATLRKCTIDDTRRALASSEMSDVASPISNRTGELDAGKWPFLCVNAFSLLSEIPRRYFFCGAIARNVHARVWEFSDNCGVMFGSLKVNENIFPPYALSFRNLIHSGNPKEFENLRNSSSFNFVKGILEENRRGVFGGSQLARNTMETNADVVHMKLMRNNAFVTLTDSKGNKKLGASSGSLPELKGGAKASRFAATATAEHVGRLARNLGLKSVVMRVNGFTFFKKKKQAILSWREGFTYSRGDQNPIVYIEDTTQKPHNGCRRRKRRRV